MTQTEYDKILAVVAYDAEMTLSMKKLWRKYQQLNGAIIFSHQPDINIYYDKPTQEGE